MSPDGKVISIISKNKVKMIEIETMRDVARVNLNDFIKTDRAILITSVEFFDDFNFGMITVQGHMIIMHYPSGTVHFVNTPEEITYFPSHLVSNGLQLIANRGHKLIGYEEK